MVGDIKTRKDPAWLKRLLLKLHGETPIAYRRHLAGYYTPCGGVAKSRRTCESAAPHPPIPIAGHRGVSYFGEIVELD